MLSAMILIKGSVALIELYKPRLAPFVYFVCVRRLWPGGHMMHNRRVSLSSNRIVLAARRYLPVCPQQTDIRRVHWHVSNVLRRPCETLNRNAARLFVGRRYNHATSCLSAPMQRLRSRSSVWPRGVRLIWVHPDRHAGQCGPHPAPGWTLS